MLTRFKKEWRELRKSKPGRRFEDRYCARKGRRSALAKPIYLVFGALLILAGFVLLPAPGPGLVVILIGAAMLAEESLSVARALDRLEVKARSVAAHARGTRKRRAH